MTKPVVFLPDLHFSGRLGDDLLGLMPVVGEEEYGNGFPAHRVDVDDDQDVYLGLFTLHLHSYLIPLHANVEAGNHGDAAVEFGEEILGGAVGFGYFEDGED